MRILFCRSNPIAPDPRVEKEARVLTEDGHEVIALGWDRSGTLSETESRAGFQLFRLKIKAEYANGMGNLPQLLRWELGLMSWLIAHQKEYDSIHACDFDTILPCLLAKWMFRKTVVYDIFDFYADHLRKVPVGIKKMIRAVDLWAIGRADAVILVDESRMRQIEGSDPRRCEIIYNSPEDLETPIASNEIFSKNASLKIAYVGLLQEERGLFEMLEVLRQHPAWEMAVAGFGGDQEKFLEAIREMPNIHWFGRVIYEDAIKISAAADVLFATYDPAITNHFYSSPNKIFEAMMLGKPIIVARDTNIDKIVKRYKNGIVVEYGKSQELENALVYLNDPEKRQLAGNNSRYAYDHEYGWSKMKIRLISIYQGIAHPPSQNHIQ